MKRECKACGYSCDEEVEWSEKFVAISCKIYVCDSDVLLTDNKGHEIRLYGCPKCNTVKFEKL